MTAGSGIPLVMTCAESGYGHEKESKPHTDNYDVDDHTIILMGRLTDRA